MNNVVKRNMDVLHRIVIPKNMLKEAGIENSSVVIMRECSCTVRKQATENKR